MGGGRGGGGGAPRGGGTRSGRRSRPRPSLVTPAVEGRRCLPTIALSGVGNTPYLLPSCRVPPSSRFSSACSAALSPPRNAAAVSHRCKHDRFSCSRAACSVKTRDG